KEAGSKKGCPQERGEARRAEEAGKEKRRGARSSRGARRQSKSEDTTRARAECPPGTAGKTGATGKTGTGPRRAAETRTAPRSTAGAVQGGNGRIRRAIGRGGGSVGVSGRDGRRRTVRGWPDERFAGCEGVSAAAERCL